MPRTSVPRSPTAPAYVLSSLCYQMQQKVVTSELFRGKKEGYAEALNQPFANSRMGKYVLLFVHSLRGSEGDA